MVLESFDVTKPELLVNHKRVVASLKTWNEKWSHVLQGEAPRNSGQGSAAPPASRSRSQGVSPAPARLLCRPEFDETEAPIDPNRRFDFPEDCIVPFEQLPELLDEHSFLFLNWTQRTELLVGGCDAS